MKNLDEFAAKAKRARRDRPPMVNVVDRVMAAVQSENDGDFEVVSLSEWFVPLAAAMLSVAAAAAILFWTPSAPAVASDPLASLVSSFRIDLD